MTNLTAAEVRARPRREVDLEPIVGENGEATSVVPLKPGGTQPPIIFLHQGFGQVFQYKRIAERIRDDISMYGIEARGLRDGLEPRTTIDEMATVYLEDIRRLQPTGPYLLAGYSFGGYLAWDLSQRLTAAGEDVRVLMIDIGPLPAELTSKMNLARKLRRVMVHHWKVWRGLEGETRKAYRVAAFRDEVFALGQRLHLDPTGRLYGLATGFGRRRSQASGYLPVFRANIKAMDGWEFEPSTHPVTLFRAELQPPNLPDQPQLGFEAKHVPAGLDVRPVPGTHTFLLNEPHVNQFVVELEAWFDRQNVATEQSAEAHAPLGASRR